MASKYHKKIHTILEEADLPPKLAQDLEKELESYFYEKEIDLALKGLKPIQIHQQIESEFGKESSIAAFFKWVYRPNFIHLLTHFLMKFRLKHLGYSVITITLLLNVWFFRFNLHEMVFGVGNYECSSYSPCAIVDSSVTERWERWSNVIVKQNIDEENNLSVLNTTLLTGYLDNLSDQILWIEIFLTAMFDTLLLSLAFGMILYPDPKKS